MNFSPFSQFANVNMNQLNQFAKFSNLTANGQVLSLVSGADGMQFLRPMDTSTAFQPQVNQQQTMPAQTYITLPITMPGAKPGDAQQTVQIQVLNPNPIQPQAPKFQMGQMQIPIQSFQQGTTVLTVAYAPQDGEMIPNHGLPDGVTVLAAIQPQDLQLIAQQAQNGLGISHQHLQQAIQQHGELEEDKQNRINIKAEPIWAQSPVTITSTPTNLTTDLNEYFQQQRAAQSINLQQYLKFSADANIKKEIFEGMQISSSENNNIMTINSNYDTEGSNQTMHMSTNSNHSMQEMSANEENVAAEPNELEVDGEGKLKRKRKTKKKQPKPKRPKPGQVHIATALDGTILFCCPECQMAYPEKESLEQHLVVHKIDRRYICDICGAGLKRKEHLERHKLGHNPERPYVCSVCMKGFKRKEHLNLHFVIHSGQKTEICGECGKGFYRKDHLRKHVKSHQTKRLKEEANAAAAEATKTKNAGTNNTPSQTNPTNSSTTQPLTQTTMNTSNNITIHVPTSDNTTLPVQIQVPQLISTTSADGTSIKFTTDGNFIKTVQESQEQ